MSEGDGKGEVEKRGKEEAEAKGENRAGVRLRLMEEEDGWMAVEKERE